MVIYEHELRLTQKLQLPVVVTYRCASKGVIMRSPVRKRIKHPVGLASIAIVTLGITAAFVFHFYSRAKIGVTKIDEGFALTYVLPSRQPPPGNERCDLEVNGDGQSYGMPFDEGLMNQGVRLFFDLCTEIDYPWYGVVMVARDDYFVLRINKGISVILLLIVLIIFSLSIRRLVRSYKIDQCAN